MTDYSKLSDAEIAERVCRKLGWDGDWISVNRWLTDLVSEGFADSVDMQYQDIESPPPLRQYLCFDWPAPIMMQKVKEWFVANDYSMSPIYFEVEWLWQASGPGCKNPQVIHVQSNRENRALYEAFLQVEVE